MLVYFRRFSIKFECFLPGSRVGPGRGNIGRGPESVPTVVGGTSDARKGTSGTRKSKHCFKNILH